MSWVKINLQILVGAKNWSDPLRTQLTWIESVVSQHQLKHKKKVKILRLVFVFVPKSQFGHRIFISIN